MDARVIWKQGMSFEGVPDSGFIMPLGTSSEAGGNNDGARPLEYLLVGLAGCTGMDVISILQKKRQDVTGFELRVHAERAAEHPRVFTHAVVEYIVSGRQIDPAAVERAVELSVTKYCPAEAMLSKAFTIEQKITIQQV
jgi:putative redox protein